MKQKKKILIPEELDEEAIALLTLDEDIEAITLNKPSKEELIEKIKDADALIIRSKTKVDSDLISAAGKLKVIARAGVGTDNIDVNFAEQSGVLVVNAPEESLDSVADLALSLILNVSRRMKKVLARTINGDFNRKDLTGYELDRKVLGLIGLGRIARKVAKRALAFGMQVNAYDPYVSSNQIDVPQVKLLSLEELLKTSDVISVHVPLTETTKHMLSKDQFSTMKKGVFIINTSRGPVIDTEALHDALLDKTVAGVGLDVVENDKVKLLLDHEEALITPHIGASTLAAQRKVGQMIVRETINILNGKEPKYPVNFPVLPDEYRDEYHLYKSLMRKMAQILLSIPHDPFNKIMLTYPERFPRNLISNLKRHFLAVYLKPLVSTPINVVNSLKIAQERDIEIIDSLVKRKREFEVIDVKIFSNETMLDHMDGYINSLNEPEIVTINAFVTSFIPIGNTFLIKYQDKPGMIGKISSFLGDNDINIAELQVVREMWTKTQLMIVKTDQKVEDSMVENMKKIDNVYWIAYNEL